MDTLEKSHQNAIVNTILLIEDDRFGFEFESSGQIFEFEVRRTVVPNLANFKVPTQSWNGVAKMAITFEPMVRFGPNFARINIFQFHCHFKGKVQALKSKARKIMPRWDM